MTTYIKCPEPPETLPANTTPIGSNQNGMMIFRLTEGAAVPDGVEVATDADLIPDESVYAALSEKISDMMDGFHHDFLETKSPYRGDRFQTNLEMAREFEAGTATAETTDALQLQADAQARKAGGTTMPVADFVGWILDWTPTSRLMTSKIEMMIVDANTDMRGTAAMIDPVVRAGFLRDLRVSAGVELG